MDLNPQQLAFKNYYCNPKSETFGNALQSALKAGFSEEYSKTITAQGLEWVSEILRDLNMKSKAEKVLDEILEMSAVQLTEGKDGESYMKIDTGLLKVKQDTAKFVAERLGKEKWATRTEITGKEGSPIEVVNSKLDTLVETLEDKNKESYERPITQE